MNHLNTNSSTVTPRIEDSLPTVELRNSTINNLIKRPLESTNREWLKNVNQTLGLKKLSAIKLGKSHSNFQKYTLNKGE
jgi:hypothetical protein